MNDCSFSQQNNSSRQGTKGSVEETNSFSNELASAINDGLYYYEQVIPHLNLIRILVVTFLMYCRSNTV